MRSEQGSKVRELECSCGQVTVIRYNGTKFVANSPAWKYRRGEEAELIEHSGGRRLRAGWYCGTPDHQLKRETDLPEGA